MRTKLLTFVICILSAFSSVKTFAQEVACKDLLSFITKKGYNSNTLSSYTLSSDWLSEVKAYTYNYQVYVVAKIKQNKYSYNTSTYIFCGIPSTNWSNFQYGGYGDSKSYGERFHKYIIKYKCDCY